MKNVVIYTDGACINNPGRGGYGIVLIYENYHKELSGGFRLTTNNRMEMMAVIVALQALKEKCMVTLHTDSKYIVDAMNQGWAKKWQSNNWQRTKTEKAKNFDLWHTILTLCEQYDVTFKWVKGHSGDRLNEICDRLAVKATKEKDLEIDQFYEDLSP